MAKNIQRPRYYEGQILGAADLQLALDHARGQIARHQRSLHSWGIAQGLELSQTSPEEIEVTAGIAVDGTGREIIVPDAVVLDTTHFRESNVAIDQPDVYYPIFLLGRDQASVAQLQFAGSCNNSESNRVSEDYEIKFGSPGADLEQEHNSIDVDTGPSGESGTDEWPILLGFVQWDPAKTEFTKVEQALLERRRRYVGVRAEEVLTPSGQLTVRTAPANQMGKPTFRIEENEEGKGELSFGLSNANGRITKVFTVNSNGDVVAAGALEGALTKGKDIRVEEIIAPSGHLTIRTAPAEEEGKPVVQIETGADGQGELSFGLSDAEGGVSKKFVVNTQGDITTKGKFKSAITDGSVLVESGVATDGIIIPLPEGISESQVANGQVKVHVHVTPRFPGSATPESDDSKWWSFPYRCFVDDQRRVHCVFRWRTCSALLEEFRPGACDYTLLAVVPTSEGENNE